MRLPLKMLTLVSAAVMLTTCGSAKDAGKDNFGKAIQAYLNTQGGLCAAVPAKDLPFTLSDQGGFYQDRKKQADALVDAGLLTKQDAQVKAALGDKMEQTTTYQITDTGKKYLVTKDVSNLFRIASFCTGAYTLVEVDNFTEPSDMMGMKASQVTFHYKVKDPAGWVNTESLRAAYKTIADQSRADIQGKAVLILTSEGWVHEKLFKR